ncbi:DUF411 domain-containing protein [Undibacterium sp. 14-3-2]|uniref:DUF411 domain-containing protein n=1 Tax=Undibacterium sp. 14-3-2 TaxID=2800129 RepID=UPI001905BB9A|nr:DUF411 domain-containing protein [Undibacterium sp. 14-3-2]MBK1891918.1 DUF411 domain-containing protein [Undibacterium sp. 14-3-2]
MTAIPRRPLLLGLLLLVTAVPYVVAANTSTAIEVWKGPNCGCCKDWIRHLEASGFTVKTFDTGNSDIRTKLGMPIRFGSCHTAKVGNYAIEGHVPARDIQRLLKERPDAIGLAVPAMPLGSPGMDGPEYQSRKDPFDVFLVKKDNQAIVFQSYR